VVALVGVAHVHDVQAVGKDSSVLAADQSCRHAGVAFNDEAWAMGFLNLGTAIAKIRDG
jgi:hypothetical protein